MEIIGWLAVCEIFVCAVFCVGSEVVPVSVKEGAPVTLHADIHVTQQETIKWYYDDIRIAEASHDDICTDVQCHKGNERFKDRLKLDKLTGSLTITNTRIADSGNYIREIFRYGDSIPEKTFNVTVYDVHAAEPNEKTRNASRTISDNSDQDVHAAEPNKKNRNASQGQSDNSDQGSGLSAAVVSVISVSVFLLIVASTVAGIKIYNHKHQTRRKRMKAHYKLDQVIVEGD